MASINSLRDSLTDTQGLPNVFGSLELLPVRVSDSAGSRAPLAPEAVVLHRFPRRARVFVAAMIGAGVVILAVSLRVLLPHEATATWFVLAGLALVTGSIMMKVPRIETRFSLSDALVFTSILLLGPERAAIIGALDALAASVRFNRGEPLYAYRTMFNVAAGAVSVWIPGHVFMALGGGTPLGLAGAADFRSLVLPLAALVVCYSLLNTGAIAMVLALTTRARIAAVWRENFAWVWVAHAWSGVAACGIAIFVPHGNLVSLLVILVVGSIGYATVGLYLRQVEASTGHVHKLNDLYLATIRALAMAIDAKDQVTHGHIRRVQVYTVGLAKALGITDPLMLQGIEAGALLHDTGKIAVPEYILNKPGQLTAAEYALMKTHVTIGAEILGGIDFPYPVIPFVRHHHENWDGTGYPDGLKGEEIPLGARILSVADCFDALTSDRPYRRAFSTEVALDILRQRSGTMYDRRVVDTFIGIHAEITATLHADGQYATETRPAEAVLLSDAAESAWPVDHVPADDIRDGIAEIDDVPRLAASGLSREEAAFVFANRLKRRVPFTTCAIYAPRAGDIVLEAIHVSGRHADLFRHSLIPLAEGLSGWVAANGQFIVNADPALDLHGPVASCQVQLASALVVPFTAAQGAKGALALYAQGADAFTLDDARLAGAAAEQLSRAMRRAGPHAAADDSQAVA